jgi:hypothetical protein
MSFVFSITTDLASEKLELVKKVIVRLKTALEDALVNHSPGLAIRPLPVVEFWQRRETHVVRILLLLPYLALPIDYRSCSHWKVTDHEIQLFLTTILDLKGLFLFLLPWSIAQDEISQQDDQEFSRSLVERLVNLLETGPVPGLTPNEQAHLIVLIQTTLEVAVHPKIQTV